MRVTAILLAAALFAAPAFADKKEKKGPVFEPNTYRFGGTYSVSSSRSASQCAAACGRDGRCVSWSFVDLPGASGPNSCELKSTAGRSETNPSSISGISPRIENRYQPTPYRDASTLLGARTGAPSITTTRRKKSSAVRKKTAAAAPRPSKPAKTAALPKRTVKTIAAPAAPATVSSNPVKKVAAPAAPATVVMSRPVTRKAAPAPAIVTVPTETSKPVAPTPVVAAKPKSAAPITVNAPANPSVKPAPQVQFQPLKRSADGTYTPTPVAKPAAATKPNTGRVVLTGPTGNDIAKSVNGRVVLTGDMAGATGGGVGETPAAPIPRNTPVNANGERTPYKDLSSREYPDYSVTQAAEEGGIESIAGEAGS